MNCQISRTVLLLLFYFCHGGHSTISKNSHLHHHHVTISKETNFRRGSSSGGISSTSSSELRERASEVVIGKKDALFADSSLSSLQSHQKRQLQPNPVKLEDGGDAHWVLKFHDLPPWTPRTHLESENGKMSKKDSEAKASKDDGHGITLDLRSYNPLTAHLLTQSYIYPGSNGLTQTDREYFAMIQSETGTSDVHFEKGGLLGRREESEIKGLASEAADGVSRQLAASDCSSGPCGGSNKASSSITTSNTAADPSISTASVASAASTTSATKTRTTATKKPLPRFAYHRVPGSFAAFRLIKPAFTELPPSPASVFDSFHDDEPPPPKRDFSRDVAAVHLVQ